MNAKLDNLPLTAPTLEDIEALAEETLTGIPPELSVHAANLLIQVADFPDDEVCREMELESPFELLGLYRGVDLTQKSVLDPRPEMDVVYLYRRPILDYWCESGDPLADVVRHVLVHEIGHHFGFSDDDMEALENQES